MKSGDLIRELRAAGWTCSRIGGSHHVFTHPRSPHIITVPHPRKDPGIGLVRAIRKLAGLT
ncbi:addiction module toxin, HicA family [Stenotrophomonas sp. ESTM1D_MKCIP4_1]|uniref:type II toxin-antitoxin system HicA family toxin n=1 Tax=Stenotrophomonas sp. ESTM1D_MKCIP4_1 TaxID=2072414 RepID=UPI000D53D86B|nr:type II toxin-antitoxin system HicA family toxin [Stenotrophomonas sp. ESTM1D_MKCIP4_1]AWH53854.1 addiction module toxin, HicA family [Stenotrophomonas sp. ESTM1D_MKCIP4_1]